MTLKQLEYVVKVAECGTVSGAAKALFVAQPSLSAAIQELESEMHLTLFHRTNKGVIVTKEGEVFLSYARQILEQTALLESRYKGDPVRKQAFCVSTQHYSFAVNAFVDLIRERGGDRYDFSLRETQTYEIIEDVAQRKSEIGLLYLNDFNRTALQKLLPFRSLALSNLKDRKGVFAVISKEEDRTQPLRSRKPSVRSKLQQAAEAQRLPAAQSREPER